MSAKIEWPTDRRNGPRPLRDPFGVVLPVAPPAPVVDAAMREAIASEVGETTPARRADALLAVRVQALIRQPSPGIAAHARNQRVALVDQCFREVLGEPPWAHELLSGAFDALRYPTVRAALADDRLFVDAAHPVRELLREAAEVATLAPLTSAGARELAVASLQDRGERLREIARNLRPMLARPPPLPEPEVAQFLEQIRDETAKRREVLERRARRIAAQELETQILGVALPDGANSFLRAGWVPMMASLLLHGGMDQPPWAEGLKLLSRLLVAIQRGAGFDDEHTRRLLADASRSLRESGLRANPHESLLASLRDALERSARP